MGLLDDAIREHLELKRRHGADPDEVSRQEREALGAPVRGEFAKREGEAAPDAADEPAEERDDVAEAEADVPVRDEVAPEPEIPEADFLDRRSEPSREPEPPEPEPDEEDPGPAGSEQVRPGDEEDPWLVEDLAEEKPEPEPPAAKPEGEDVLEETPEFLQETPEHDRLWFEQKPPRDFDWDK